MVVSLRFLSFCCYALIGTTIANAADILGSIQATPKHLALRFDRTSTRNVNEEERQRFVQEKERQYRDLVAAGKVSKEQAREILDQISKQRSQAGSSTFSWSGAILIDGEMAKLEYASDRKSELHQLGPDFVRVSPDGGERVQITNQASCYSQSYGALPLMPFNLLGSAFLREASLTPDKQIVTGFAPVQDLSHEPFAASYLKARAHLGKESRNVYRLDIFIENRLFESWHYLDYRAVGGSQIPFRVKRELFGNVSPGAQASFVRQVDEYKLREANDLKVAATFEDVLTKEAVVRDYRTVPAKEFEYVGDEVPFKLQLATAKPVEVLTYSKIEKSNQTSDGPKSLAPVVGAIATIICLAWFLANVVRLTVPKKTSNS